MLVGDLPVESVDAALDIVVDEARVENVLSKLSVVMAVGDEHVIVELHPTTTGFQSANEDDDEDENDGEDRKEIKFSIT